jgi:hypothetical protein
MIAMLVAVAACAEDPPLPTCEEAIDAYYDAGCYIGSPYIRDRNDREGARWWCWAGRSDAEEMVDCIDAYDQLRVCLAEMPNGCDCKDLILATDWCRY